MAKPESKTFHVGDRVMRVAGGETGVVVGAGSPLGYEVSFATGTLYLDGTALQPVSENPQQALLRNDLGRAEVYGLAIQALYLQHAYRYDDMAGLSSARIEPAFHQVMTALRVLSKTRPRMILADEVGLGKTIEAGMILKELRARQMVERALIVVPPSLQWQWRQELSSKFNEEFQVLDGPLIKSLEKRGENPWRLYDNVICSLNTARRNDRAQQILEAGWDMAIFDEAHKVRRSLPSTKKIVTTQAYRLADELKETVYGLLLLTATPMQLHPFELYSLIELVEPGLFESFEQYEAARQWLPDLTKVAKCLQEWEKVNASDRGETQSFVKIHLPSGEGLDLDRREHRERALEDLSREFPLSRTLVRNRKSEVGGFTKRLPQVVRVEMLPEEIGIYQDVNNYIRDEYDLAQREDRKAVGFVMVSYQKMLASSSNAIRGALLKRIAKLREKLGSPASDWGNNRPTEDDLDDWTDPRELSAVADRYHHETRAGLAEELRAEIDRLEQLVFRLGKIRDSKAREFLRILREDIGPDEKILVFTQFLDTQTFLKATLESQGYGVEIFNGVMSQEHKDETVRRFRDRSQIMISTEAGGEGRNFQFAHVMFNYDLPWNPMKVEQRIGRLDRIGQKRDVVIYNFACQGTVEERILEVLEDRIGLFEESVGPLDPILGDVSKEIERMALSKAGNRREDFQAIASEWEQKVKESRRLEKERRYFALDPSTFRRDQANRLVEKRVMAEFSDLANHVGMTLRYYGGNMTDHEKGGVGIYLSGGLQRRLKRDKRSYRGVFDYRLALEREDLDFFAFGHGLIDAIVSMPLESHSPLACHRRVSGVQGGPYLEVFYALEGEGPARFGVFVRHLVSKNLTVEEEVVTEMPQVGGAWMEGETPEWLGAAFDVSASKIADKRLEADKHVFELQEKWRREELERTERMYTYQKVRLMNRIRDERAWIDEKEKTGTSQERRVLPARRGMLAKNRRRLAGLEEDRRDRVQDIESRASDLSIRLLAAALVVGE